MRVAVVLLSALLLATGACSPGGPTLTVLAASSLTEAFEAIARDFEEREGVEVRLSLAGSQQLATQVLEGAPADVLATADEVQMDRVAEAGLVAGTPEVFAHNALVVVTGPGVTGVRSVTNLDAPDLDVVLAAPEVPAGRYAREVLEGAGIDVAPVSLEPSVRGVLAKVSLGEADAGIVYASDVDPDDTSVDAVPLPRGMGDEVRYPIAVLEEAADDALARAFVDHVRSPAGQARLWQRGFRVEDPPS